MIDLNRLCEVSLKNADERHSHGANIDTDTRKMLKHCATEVVEAMEAYTACLANVFSDEEQESKDWFASELADIICCVLTIAGKEKIDIEEAVNACIEKNRKRAERIGDKL